MEASVEAPLHPLLTVYVDYCVATLKPDPLSSPSYSFITNYGSVGPSGSKSKILCICVWFKVLNSTHLKWFSVEHIPTPKPNSPLMKLFLNSQDHEFYLDLHKFAHAHIILHHSTKLCGSPSCSFCVILLNNRLTHNCRWKHNPLNLMSGILSQVWSTLSVSDQLGSKALLVSSCLNEMCFSIIPDVL